ncbi:MULTISPECIES: NAD(P)H-hydrate dehydratase [unclassified Clostridium]|uniref:NAD(P)H-hydrate dehydratase n=1 Tax=unclassified Clostridium TaxID=2614128 RepID=UPI000E4A7A9A|nr:MULTISPECIES: NAD(P)H-hydrate dehydratase [unclassified Clostridium]RHS90117.1 NAD(P)H-hydrate dehydratase [Clostridium sp. AM42-4]RHV89687.1 NAD(P)H-hydrate dehydratase [Clostridium sp. OF09-36]HBM46516.1 bifunctional ADP-dependent NAD(P)H-hydrate dehydratase/NAD(P)H-hydrate epimerase [Lachnoclostridium sp.]
MDYAVTAQQMKAVDQNTIQGIGIPSMVLMERAALAVAEAAVCMADERGLGKRARILVACGTGNNGADGVAAGRILQGRGYEVRLFFAGNPEHDSEEMKAQKRIAQKLQLVQVTEETYESEPYDIILDALFGIGLGREITGAYRQVLETLERLRQKWNASVIAVDTPSGIHGSTGEVMGIAFRADVTVTFGYAKTGLLLYPGKQYAGRLTVADIGFPEISLQKAGWDAKILTPEDLNQLPVRRPDGNKGTFGKVLILAGSRGMSGAAYFSALGAYRTGAGLVKVLTVPENRQILQTQLPEAIVSCYDPDNEETMQKILEDACAWADVIVAGPGLGQEPYTEYLLETVLSDAYVPIVLDADGLNCVASHPYLTRYFTENIIITPHIGEMSRLVSVSAAGIKKEPLEQARAYSARYGTICVLKDAVTVITDKDGNAWINQSGCSAMAKGGSGDVLTGVIAGLLARGMECAEAAAFGVYLHGRAGEYAAAMLGDNGVLATDLANSIGKGPDHQNSRK